MTEVESSRLKTFVDNALATDDMRTKLETLSVIGALIEVVVSNGLVTKEHLEDLKAQCLEEFTAKVRAEIEVEASKNPGLVLLASIMGGSSPLL